MHPIPIFSTRTSPRLLYILDWLFSEQLRTGYRLVTSRDEAAALPFCIAYGTTFSNGLSIPDKGLLWAYKEEHLTPDHALWNGIPVFFYSGTQNHTLSFDLFSALFLLLSRQEEYRPYTPDKHGRYPATESLLHKMQCLERPLADEWIAAFRQLLQQDYQTPVPTPAFSFQPTYDIDMAWSYKYKGGKRQAGAALKDLLTGNMTSAKERLAVLLGKKKDPYDSFQDLEQLHRIQDLQPYYFVLASLRTTAFDKNIHPAHPAMQTLIRQLAAEGEIGIHPSYYSGKDPQQLHAEKQQLESILQKKIHYSRQHYIKMKLPETYRMLTETGITEDFSMGYGTHPGFRAGTGQSFPWYDLEKEITTSLRIHPFCFMDTTARYDAGLSAAEAFRKLEQMTRRLQASRSRLITVFHNFSLGSDPGWNGWEEAYHAFVGSVARHQRGQ